MKKQIVFCLLVLFFLPFLAFSQTSVAMDNASNYGGVWNSGSNGGTGFGPWTITASGGSGFAGVFIGNPSSAGISGMSTTSFGLFANPVESGAFVNADRNFEAPLAVGATFSLDWGVNFDSDGIGNKGLNLYDGSEEIININQGGNATITINGNIMFANYGTQVMTLYFEYTNATSLRVYGTGRDGTETYDNTFAISAAPVGFRFYASELEKGDERQPYFNNLAITAPLPVALIAFHAERVRESVSLRWEYEMSSELSHFEVEHSTDGRSWSIIGDQKPPNYNSDNRQALTYLDQRLLRGRNYYRLNAIGHSGEERRSPVRSVLMDTGNRVRLINSLIVDELVIAKDSDADQILLELMDAQGIIHRSVKWTDASAQFTISMSNLPSGWYLLKAHTGAEIFTYKVMKI